VPLLRGSSRSASLTGIHDVCRRAVESGFKEIVLTGTHIGQYRDATEGGLWALLEKITGISGDYRIRLSSLDPRDLSGALIRLAATHPRVCDHLHVSVQSLSQKVLDRMNRSATDSGSIVELLAKARADFPRMGIGADFIAGFPGETEAQFEETVDNVRKIGFSYGHVFRYSRRPFTPAASFPDHLDEKEKTRRSARLRAVIDECRSDFIRGCEGSVQRIIAETEEPVTGYSSNYLRLEARGALCKRNDWCAAVVDAYDPGIGRCIASVAR
jgi:threonylcarbamoyladenosine tRNA methylthiotransferase MtaB